MRTDDGLRVTIETPPRLEGCRRCGVVAHGHGRRDRLLHDIPCFGAPVTVIWRKHTYVCPDAGCPVATFSEELPSLARPRALLSTRAIWWVIGPLRRDHASVQDAARRLGVDWHTVWDAIKPVLHNLAKDEGRVTGVSRILGSLPSCPVRTNPNSRHTAPGDPQRNLSKLAHACRLGYLDLPHILARNLDTETNCGLRHQARR